MNNLDKEKEKKEEKNKEKKVKKVNIIINIVGLSIFLIIMIVLGIAIVPYIKKFIDDPMVFKEFIKENGFLGVLIFLSIQVLQVIVSIIPGEFVEIAAGVSFGWFFGLVLCEIGLAIGTVIIFVVCKKFGRPIIDLYVGKGKLKKFDALDKSSKRDKILFILFFIPGIPKDILIYASAFFNISLGKFLVISLIARIPSIVTSTIAGQYLLEKNYVLAIIIFVVTGLVAVLSYVFYDKIYKKLTHKKESD